MNNTKTEYDIIEDLRATSSRLSKESILLKEKGNEVLKYFFKLALDPHIQFYQKKIPAYSPSEDVILALDPFYALECLEKILSKRVLTGHDAINYLKSMLEHLEESYAKLIELVIKKDPDCGVSEATVNKIWPGLISSYPVMLCSPYEQKNVDRLHWKRGVYAQLKSDGCRVNIIIDKDGNVSLYSRNGRLFDTLGSFDYLKHYGKNVVIDGELLVVNNGKFLDRKSGNGICNQALKGTISQKNADLLFVNAWDLISLDDFRAGISTEEYESRYTNLCGLVYTASDYSPIKNIGVVPTRVVHSLEEAERIYEQYIAAGEEGIILKDKSVIWENKRSKQLIKMKSEIDVDLLVTDVIPGTGKYENMIGSLVCTDKDNIINVNVGSGLTDADRSLPKEFYIGKVITVTYNAKIQTKTGEYSLFLPRFIEKRNDKTVPNSFAEIK
jgi:hypothetical protein